MEKEKGVTLVELAIVIVIIGLLIGGVIAGQELIKQAVIYRVVSELEDLNRASATFYVQYKDIPGDFSKATKVFPNGNTVNGNGNGILDSDTERLVFWHHLSLAQLVKGFFDPRPYIISGDMADYNTDKMFPKTGAGGYYSPVYYSSGLFAGINWMMMVEGVVTNGSLVYSGVLDNMQIYDIDRKLDDGKPFTGIIRNYSDSGEFNHSCNIPGQNAYNVDINQTDQQGFKCVLIDEIAVK